MQVTKIVAELDAVNRRVAEGLRGDMAVRQIEREVKIRVRVRVRVRIRVRVRVGVRVRVRVRIRADS